MIRIFDPQHDLSEIFVNLWQGSRPWIPEEIVKREFNTIVFCENDHQPEQEEFPGMKILRCPLVDDYEIDLTKEEISLINSTADEVVKDVNDGKKILIVCYAGLNRSGLVMGVTLNKYLKFSGVKCANMIRNARNKYALHNPIFVDHLHSLEGN